MGQPPQIIEQALFLFTTGCFGEVFKCLVKSSSSSSRKERVQAMKVVPASRRSSRRELEVLRAVGREDENVAGMNHFFYLGGGGGDGEKMLHLLSDYASCGTLFDELQHKDKGDLKFKEKISRKRTKCYGLQASRDRPAAA